MDGWARVPTFLAAGVCALALAWVQLSFPGLLDGDSQFHARAAEQLRAHGVQSEFPQAAFSTWKDHYSDKDFLFHALTIPFVNDPADLAPGGKRAAILFGVLLCAILATSIELLGLRFGPLWVVLALAAAPGAVEYLVLLRPHVLALALFPLELALLLTGRLGALATLAGLHVLTHSSFAFVPALPLAYAAASWLHGRSLPWRSLAATVGGIAVASLLHPYFPNNLTLAWDQLVEVASNAWIRPVIDRDLMGPELYGMAPQAIVLAFPAWLPAVAGIVWAVRRSPRADLSIRSLTLALVSVGFLALSLLSSRFFPLFVVHSALLAGSLWTELSQGWSWRRLAERGNAVPRAAALLLAVCGLAAVAQASVPGAPARINSHRLPGVYRPAIAFLSRVAAPEEQVYHSFWWPFAWLYFFRPEGRYVAGLDPIFLYRYDPRLFHRMLEAHRGRGDAYQIVARDFGARWAFVEKLPRTQPLRNLLQKDARFRRRYADRFAEVYEVSTPQATP